MKTYYSFSNYGIDLALTKKDAHLINQSGDASNRVDLVVKKPYVKKQLAKLDAELIAKELKEYGAWDDEELKDHAENLTRFVWVMACNLSDELFENEN